MSEDIEITRLHNSNGSEYDRVLAFIREQLMTGRLKTGDRLISERELASKLGVSRPVIREALRTIAALGAVEIRQGQGTVVRTPDFAVLSDFFSLALAQHADAVDDVIEARIAIERHAIKLACTRATSGDLGRLENALKDIIETVEDPEAGGAADFAFHSLIVESAHSIVLKRVYDAIYSLLHRSHAQRRGSILHVAGSEKFLIDHHTAILEAIKDGDPDRADVLLAEHFRIGANFRRRGTA